MSFSLFHAFFNYCNDQTAPFVSAFTPFTPSSMEDETAQVWSNLSSEIACQLIASGKTISYTFSSDRAFLVKPVCGVLIYVAQGTCFLEDSDNDILSGHVFFAHMGSKIMTDDSQCQVMVIPVILIAHLRETTTMDIKYLDEYSQKIFALRQSRQITKSQFRVLWNVLAPHVLRHYNVQYKTPDDCQETFMAISSLLGLSQEQNHQSSTLKRKFDQNLDDDSPPKIMKYNNGKNSSYGNTQRELTMSAYQAIQPRLDQTYTLAMFYNAFVCPICVRQSRQIYDLVHETTDPSEFTSANANMARGIYVRHVLNCARKLGPSSFGYTLFKPQFETFFEKHPSPNGSFREIFCKCLETFSLVMATETDISSWNTCMSTYEEYKMDPVLDQNCVAFRDIVKSCAVDVCVTDTVDGRSANISGNIL